MSPGEPKVNSLEGKTGVCGASSNPPLVQMRSNECVNGNVRPGTSNVLGVTLHLVFGNLGEKNNICGSVEAAIEVCCLSTGGNVSCVSLNQTTAK